MLNSLQKSFFEAFLRLYPLDSHTAKPAALTDIRQNHLNSNPSISLFQNSLFFAPLWFCTISTHFLTPNSHRIHFLITSA